MSNCVKEDMDLWGKQHHQDYSLDNVQYPVPLPNQITSYNHYHLIQNSLKISLSDSIAPSLSSPIAC